jgi:hypothetical protein
MGNVYLKSWLLPYSFVFPIGANEHSIGMNFLMPKFCRCGWRIVVVALWILIMFFFIATSPSTDLIWETNRNDDVD